MNENIDSEENREATNSIEEMLQHLPEAKQLAKKRRTTTAKSKSWSKKAKLMRQ